MHRLPNIRSLVLVTLNTHVEGLSQCEAPFQMGSHSGGIIGFKVLLVRCQGQGLVNMYMTFIGNYLK